MITDDHQGERMQGPETLEDQFYIKQNIDRIHPPQDLHAEFHNVSGAAGGTRIIFFSKFRLKCEKGPTFCLFDL